MNLGDQNVSTSSNDIESNRRGNRGVSSTPTAIAVYPTNINASPSVPTTVVGATPIYVPAGNVQYVGASIHPDPIVNGGDGVMIVAAVDPAVVQRRRVGSSIGLITAVILFIVFYFIVRSDR